MNRFVAKTSNDRRREECEGSLRHDVCNISKVMGEHPGTECRRHPFRPGGVVSIIASTTLLQPVLCKAFVVLVEPFCSCGVVWQTEPEWDSAEDGDDALNDKQPSKSFEASGAIDLSNAIRDAD